MSGVVPLRRAFVTGATGGIGSALCERLSSEGWRVRLAELMQGCDAVFHLAAMVHVQGYVADSAFRRINVDGTRAVVSAARAAQVPTLVFFNTAAVYPESEEVFDESSPVALRCRMAQPSSQPRRSFSPRVGLEEGIASAIAGFRLDAKDNVGHAARTR